MQNQERQLPTVGNRVYFDDQQDPTQSGWYLLHRVRNVSGSIDSPDALVTLCRENNEPGDYISALASEISLTGPQTVPGALAEAWPHGATVKLRYAYSGNIARAKRDASMAMFFKQYRPAQMTAEGTAGISDSSIKTTLNACFPEASLSVTEPEIRKVLVLSTNHLTKHTCLEYKSWPFIADFEEGCYFYVGDEPESYTDAPEELRQVLTFAKHYGCTEVKFDRDADVLDHLPCFEW